MSKDIQKEFSGINGYSSDNLWCMRQMYEEYFEPAILERFVPELQNLKELKK